MNELLSRILLHLGLLSVYALLYMAISRNRLYTLVSVILGMATYSLVLVLSRNGFGMAAGLGLFAVFGILRYRTESIGIAEMTYVFSVITISVIGAMTDGVVLVPGDALAINASLIALSCLLFLVLSRTAVSRRTVHVDSLDWLSLPEEGRRAFLKGKSFADVRSFTVEHIDWHKETCTVEVCFRERG